VGNVNSVFKQGIISINRETLSGTGKIAACVGLTAWAQFLT
jgi:hypothetical protein